MAEWKRRKKYRIDKDQEEPVVHRGYQITNLLRREFVLTLIFVAISTTALLGGSYAIFTNIQKAEHYNMIKSGTLQIAYDDTSSGLGNIIRLNGAFPESDVAGQEREPYRFKITNTGSLNAEYKVKILDDLSMIEEDGCQNKLLDRSVLKYSIDGGEPVLLSTIQDEYIAVNGNLSARESITYEIRMWIDESAGNEVLGRHYHGKIVVEGEQVESLGKASDVIFDEARLGEKGAIDTRDEEQTFITGEDPNNYVWYSGKLWRAVSKDPSDNSVKLVTQWPMTAISYSSENNAMFEGSYAEEWLNDTSVDGFLGNLREPEKFIKMDSLWNATEMQTRNKPAKITIVKDPVGLLNLYEYSIDNATYLNNTLISFLLTPYDSTHICYGEYGKNFFIPSTDSYSLRPAINLKSVIEVVSGEGTSTSPYRLMGEQDALLGTLLKERYSGEYVEFGANENSLYRIVNREFGGVKLVSAEPLKDGGSFVTKKFNTSGKTIYNPSDETYEIAYFLNHSFLDPNQGFLTESQLGMIQKSIWYLGTVDTGVNYKFAKYSNIDNQSLALSTEAFVGLLRLGEQFATQMQGRVFGTDYYLLTRNNSGMRSVINNGGLYNSSPSFLFGGIRPSVHLKESIKITGGEGTKQNPFTIGQ